MLGSIEKLFAKASDSSDDDDDDDDDVDLGLFSLLGTVELGSEIESIFRDGESHAITVNENEDTFLHVAARTRNPAFAKLLIEEGAAVDAQNKRGQTPLTLAIENDAVEVVELLVDAGANVDLRDDDRDNWPAAMIGQRHWATREIVRYFSKELRNDCLGAAGKEALAKKLIELNWSLLHVVKLGDAESTRIALQFGLAKDIDEIDHDYTGQTALHLAVKFADLENVKVLLEREANVNAEDFENRMPLSYAYDSNDNEHSNERLEIVKMLIEREATLFGNDIEYDCSAFEVFQYGSREAIELLLQVVDLTVVGEEFKSCLVYSLAANEYHPDAIVELRGRMRFDVDLLDKPMIIAAMYGNAPAVEFLLDEGADVDNVDPRNITAVHCIFRSGCPEQRRYRECLQVLLERGASVELKNDERDELTILDVVFRARKFLLGQLVLCHLALQEVSGGFISRMIRARIESHILFKSYFESSKRRLTMEIIRSVTLLDLLCASDEKFELYLVGNEELVLKASDFVMDELSGYYYFRSLLQKRLAKAVLRHKSARVVCKILGTSYGRFPVVVDKVVSYLAPKDMENLIDA